MKKTLYSILAFWLTCAIFSVAVFAAPVTLDTPITSDNLVECADGKRWVFACAPGNELEQLKAFPTCEGVGCQTTHGRGGALIKVTTLADSGAGSFREAMTTAGARIITFDVSGIIHLDSELRVLDPNYYIAAQTSPSGVLITGARFILQAGEGVIRHARIRMYPTGNLETLDALSIYGPTQGHAPGANNVVIDHSSFSWGVDENVSTYYGATNINFQWNAIHWGLSNVGHPDGEHSKGANLSGKEQEADIAISFHHNFLAHNGARNPEIGDPDNGFRFFADIRNNVVYNVDGARSGSHVGNAEANWVDNYVKAGNGTNSGNNAIFPMRVSAGTATPNAQIYSYHNLGPKALDDGTGDPTTWRVGDGYTGATINIGWQRLIEWPHELVTTTTMTTAYADTIVAAAGASVPAFDYVDIQAQTEYAAGIGVNGGNIGGFDSLTYPASFPTFAVVAQAADTDNDGMADAWETARGIASVGVDDRNTTNSLGYTYLELYLNELADGTWSN